MARPGALLASSCAALLVACGGAKPDTAADGGAGAGDECRATTCGAAYPAITLRITRAGDGGSVADVTVTPHGAACRETSNATVCEVAVFQPGTYALTVSAPGYVSQTVEVEVVSKDQCCQPYDVVLFDLALQPA